MNKNHPVFIVGVARSGTALLRALLNQHPQLVVDPYAADFLPKWLRNWDKVGDLSDPSRFSKFYQEALYLGRIKKKAKLQGNVISEKVWYDMCQDYSLWGVFDALVRFDTGQKDRSNVLWVNKAPPARNCLDLLHIHFPKARVIHIIRDVRDTVLSQHWFTLKKLPQYKNKIYQDIWRQVCEKRGRKGLIVLAQDWTDTIKKTRFDAQKFNEQYLEVNYESLLDTPKKELKRICEFIGVEFVPELLEIRKGLQPGTDKKVTTQIQKTNKQKYKNEIPPHILYKIEEISSDLLRDLDYELQFEWAADYTGRRLSKTERGKFRFHDYLNFLTTAIAQAGLLNGIKIAAEIALKRGRGIPKKG